MSECIQWHKCLNERGYGQEFYNGKNTKAHRAEWMKVNGPIPDGFILDHTCHNEAARKGECQGGVTCSHRACVNLEHLELVTQRENVLRGLHSRDSRTTCPKGHENNEANTMIRKSGKRECAECNRARSRAVWANRVKAA